MSHFQRHIFSIIESSKDGYALFDKNDVLIFANAAFHNLFYTSEDDVNSLSFEQIMRRNYAAKRGVNISSGDIERFIEYVHSVRRSIPYRLFEVDYVDKRWMLFSEQATADGQLWMQMTDITKQKVTQIDLQSRLSKFEKLALTDELTGLANRRAFKDSLATEIARLNRAGRCATLLVLDLDHFKNVNDTFGHTIGDEVLAHCAGIMKSCIRPSDIIGRIGGEEFAIFLSETDSEQACDIAGRVKERIATTPLKTDEHTVNLTVSVGLASMMQNISFATLYETADQALYEAKHKGRNQVCTYQEME